MEVWHAIQNKGFMPKEPQSKRLPTRSGKFSPVYWAANNFGQFFEK
jgi:hypothetical protein